MYHSHWPLPHKPTAPFRVVLKRLSALPVNLTFANEGEVPSPMRKGESSQSSAVQNVICTKTPNQLKVLSQELGWAYQVKSTEDKLN